MKIRLLQKSFPNGLIIYASTAGVTAAAGISSLLVKRHLTLLRLLAERALRRFSSMGLSKARRRRISSRIPSVSSLVLRRLRARSIGSPLRTVTERMIMCVFVNDCPGTGRQDTTSAPICQDFSQEFCIFFKIEVLKRQKSGEMKGSATVQKLLACYVGVRVLGSCLLWNLIHLT